MNNKALTLSLVMAAIAVFFVNSYVTSIEDDAKKKFGTEVRVVVARQDIREMDTVTENLLETKLVPKRFLEPSAITLDKKEGSEEVFTDEVRKLSGSVAIVPIKKGEQITFTKISEPSMRTGLAPEVAPGKRAVAISVNEVSAVGKLIKPGDRVDVIAVMEGRDRNDKTVRTVLQDVSVLAVGKYVTNNLARVIEKEGKRERVRNLNESDSYGAVTLEVDPAQAQLLVLVQAMNANGIVLTLRNSDDTDRITNLPQINVQDLTTIDVGNIRRMPAANPPSYPINRGGGR